MNLKDIPNVCYNTWLMTLMVSSDWETRCPNSNGCYCAATNQTQKLLIDGLLLDAVCVDNRDFDVMTQDTTLHTSKCGFEIYDRKVSAG
jgi:hypothetical protein